MDYISKIIIEVLEEKFKDDKSYLSEKKAELKKNKTKADGLEYFFNRVDSKIKEQVITKLANNGGWKIDEDDISYMIHYSNMFFRMT